MASGRLTVTLKIDRPWHVYANPVGHEDLEAARTTVEVFAGGKKLSRCDRVSEGGAPRKTRRGRSIASMPANDPREP